MGAASSPAEAALKNARNYGGAAYAAPAAEGALHQHFGLVIASCERRICGRCRRAC